MNRLFKAFKIFIYIELAVLYILACYWFLIYGVPMIVGKNVYFFHYFVGFTGCLIIPSIIMGIKFKIKPQPYKPTRSDVLMNPTYTYDVRNIYNHGE